MNWISFLLGIGACLATFAALIGGGIFVSSWHEARLRNADLSPALSKAVALLREVRGTLRTDQYDGHVRIAAKIDDFLRGQP